MATMAMAATTMTTKLATLVSIHMPTDATSALRTLPLVHASGNKRRQSTGRCGCAPHTVGCSARRRRCCITGSGMSTSSLKKTAMPLTRWISKMLMSVCDDGRSFSTRATKQHPPLRRRHLSPCRAKMDDDDEDNNAAEANGEDEKTPPSASLPPAPPPPSSASTEATAMADEEAASAAVAGAVDSEPVPERGSASEPDPEPASASEQPDPEPVSEAGSVFVEPELGPFRVRDDVALDIGILALGSVLRVGAGLVVDGYRVSLASGSEQSDDVYGVKFAGMKLAETSSPGRLPDKPIELYEFESCPFCRKVREAVAFLDLDVLFYPCPRGGPTFRPRAKALGGKSQFPYMVDPNSHVSMYESDEIIKYLFTQYGNGDIPIALRLGVLTTLTCGLAVGTRGLKGSRYTPALMPDKPLELWAYESSPFCRLVRECLGELELPHIYHSVARGSPKRQRLYDKWGRFQVPYLEDPNTGVSRFESAYIVDYLRSTYALPSAEPS